MTALEQYQQFLDGEWTRERPMSPGYYPVCAIGCEDSGPGSNLVLVVDFGGGKIQPVTSWGGWWWTRPLPTNFALPLPQVSERSRSSRPPIPR